MDNRKRILNTLIQSYQNGTSISSVFDDDALQNLVNDDSEDIRLWLAKALVNQSCIHSAVPLLCKLSRDESAYVRVEAVDSLCAFINRDSFDALCLAICDDDELVRTYAAFGIAAVGKSIDPQKARNLLLNIAAAEQSRRVLVDTYTGLYLLGDIDRLQQVFHLFFSDDYHIQCAVLHSLSEIINVDNSYEIKRFVDGLNASAYAYAVADAISQVKKVCFSYA